MNYNFKITKSSGMAREHTLKLPLITSIKLFLSSYILQIAYRFDTARRLINYLKPKTPAAAATTIGGTIVSSSDISVDPARDLWFRLYVPLATDKQLPLIVYFHGGGFSILSAHSQQADEFCRTLAAKIPAVIASVNYRLAPEHKCPSQYDDGFDALKFINDKNYEILPSNTDLERCFLGGDSAGGNLAHHVAVMAGKDRRAVDKVKLTGMVAVQPFFGGEERTEAEVRLSKAPLLTVEITDEMWRLFLPAGADRNHPAVKVFGGGDEGVKSVEFPATLVVVGGFDVLQDWQRKYGKWLEKSGKEVVLVEYGNAFHGFYYFQELPEFGFLLDDVKRFITNHLEFGSS